MYLQLARFLGPYSLRKLRQSLCIHLSHVWDKTIEDHCAVHCTLVYNKLHGHTSFRELLGIGNP